MSLNIPLSKDAINNALSKLGPIIKLANEKRKDVSNILASGVPDTVNTALHYVQEIRNAILNRQLSAEDIEALMEKIGLNEDVNTIREFMEDRKIPWIYYEMLEGVQVIKDFNETTNLDSIFQVIDQHSTSAESDRPTRLYVVGEGSSRAIPANLAVKQGLDMDNVEVLGGSCTEVEDIHEEDIVVIMSNSGETDTAIQLADRANASGALTISVTTNETSSLATKCEHLVHLKCGKEEAVGATKSVVEQILVAYEITMGKDKKPDYDQVSQDFQSLLTQSISPDILRQLSLARELIIVGKQGIHKEANLKVAETIGVPVRTIDSPDLLHGDEETFQDHNCVLIFDPDPEKVEKIEKLISSRIPVFYVTSEGLSQSIPEDRVINIEHDSPDLQPLMNLAAVQNILVRLAIYKGSNCTPKHARKVGDAHEG